jgi:hypothetical protein
MISNTPIVPIRPLLCFFKLVAREAGCQFMFPFNSQVILGAREPHLTVVQEKGAF